LIFLWSGLSFGVVAKDFGPFAFLSVRREFLELLTLSLGLRLLFRLCSSRRLRCLFFLPVLFLLLSFLLKVLHLFPEFLKASLDGAIPNIGEGWLRKSFQLTPDFLDHAISGRYGNLRDLGREV